MRALLIALVAGTAAVAAGHPLNSPPAQPAAPRQETAPGPLAAHEWGTFTSFSGSDGVPVSFEPNNVDLPSFVYFSQDLQSKAGRLRHGGLVSMETPVIYFYTDRDTRVSVKVDFLKGWITEWYPFAMSEPERTNRIDRLGGQSIRWNVKLVPNDPVRFPQEKAKNHYYAARETDAVPLQAVVAKRENDDEDREWALRGGTLVQSEKFLFYRGVGTFPPPVTVKALGGGKVRVSNSLGDRVNELVLVTVHDGKVGFQTLADIDARGEATATIPEATGAPTDLAAALVQSLTAAGLYEREAKAMVKTWDDAWFKEEGTRLLYLVPRAKTDELLPITIDPKPAELVRVLVGRHDFLTPEQEAIAERQLARINAANVELKAAYEQLNKLGRFSAEAQQAAAKRMEAKVIAAQK
jgi:hypothetical protein